LDASYFQKKTKATALFEFIGRDDIFLESKLISLSFENANRKSNIKMQSIRLNFIGLASTVVPICKKKKTRAN